MKKSFLFFSIVASICLISCNTTMEIDDNGGSETTVHEHTFDNDIWEYNETQHWHPSTCGHNVTSTPQNHVFAKSEKPATFEEDGVITYTCSVCGYFYEEKGDNILNHNYSSAWNYNEESHWHDCTDIGYENLKNDESVHSFNDVVVEPTYESSGYTTHICSICGYSYTDSETIKFEHNYSSTWSYNETSHWHVCIDTGYENLKSDESSHKFNNVVTNPTYDSGGYTTHTCTVCGYSYTDNETDRLIITITWLNYDGTILDTESYYQGETPSYKGQTPKRNNDEQYSYTFSGWTPEIVAATIDTTYTATFTSNLVKAKIIFNLNGGTTSHSTEPVYSSSLEASDFFFDVNKENYNFRGWSYNGTKIFDEKGNKLFSPELEKEMMFTALFVQDVIVTITTNYINGGIISGAGTYPYNTNVKVTATPYDGYYFVGWYYEDSLLSNQETYNYMMWDQDVTLEVRWGLIQYSITYNLDGGINSKNNPDTYTIEDEISLGNATKQGYTFINWTLNSEIITSISKGTIGNLTLNAYYSINSYGINVVSNDGNKGTVSGSGTYEYDSVVTVAATPKEYCQFDGWYINNSKVSNKEIYAFKTPAESTTLLAMFSYKTYKLHVGSAMPEYGSVMFKGDSDYSKESKSQIKYTESVSISALTTTDEHSFLGWFDENDELVSTNAVYTFVMPHSNYHLFAKWEDSSSQYYNLSVTSNDLEKGVTTGSGSYKYGQIVKVNASPNEDYIFKGWYNESTKVDNDLTYAFAMPKSNYSLVARFFTKAEEEEEARRLGAIPTLSTDGKTITYGLYPQTNVNDSTLVSALNELKFTESNGWYLYEGNYYAKVSATPYDLSYKFDNFTTIVFDTTYWFKCEPITWNVLSNSAGQYYIVSSVLLDAHCYYNSSSYRTIDDKTVYANNYEYSDIRAWLNNDFYNSAFALGNGNIQTTTVDNSSLITGISSNKYISNNTQDKVFLASYQDYINSSYGFSTSTDSTDTRYCRTTDWARARGAFYYTNDKYYRYNGYYQTRSPGSYANTCATVSSDGSIHISGNGTYLVGSFSDDTIVTQTNNSVRPAITIMIT